MSKKNKPTFPKLKKIKEPKDHSERIKNLETQRKDILKTYLKLGRIIDKLEVKIEKLRGNSI